jgi:ketosteroid isomerase-like protein
MSQPHSAEQLLRRAYDAFNARDVDGALALMHPDVDWPNAMECRREHGHEAVCAYWTRQFGLIDSHVEPVGFSEDGEGRWKVNDRLMQRVFSAFRIAAWALAAEVVLLLASASSILG